MLIYGDIPTPTFIFGSYSIKLHVSSVNRCFISSDHIFIIFLTDKTMHIIYYEDITLIDVHPRGGGVCRGGLVTHLF